MINVFNSYNIFISPINTLSSIFFFFGILFFADKKFKFLFNRDDEIIKNSAVIISVLIFIINLLCYFDINFTIVRYVSFFISFNGFIFLLFNYNKIQKFIYFFFQKNTKVVSALILLIFINSLLSPIDIDSLDYHIGYPSFLDEINKYKANINWFHSIFFFSGEAIALIGFFLRTENLLYFTNFLSILILFKTVEKYSYPKEIENKIKIILISTPVLIQLILSSKPVLLGIALMIYAFSEINLNPKKKNYTYFYLLFFGASFRYENFILLAIILGYFFFKTNSKKYIFLSSVVGFLINIAPILLRNNKYFGNPLFPFLSDYFNSSYELTAQFLDFKNNLGTISGFKGLDAIIYFPLSLFVSNNTGYYISSLGIVTLYLVILAFNKKNFKVPFLIALLYFAIISVLGKFAYPRFFLPSAIILIVNSDKIIKRASKKIIGTLLFISTIFAASVLLYSLKLSGLMIISENYKNKILTEVVENYKIYDTVRLKYFESEIYDLSNSRNHFHKRATNIIFNDNNRDINANDLIYLIKNKIYTQKVILLIIDKTNLDLIKKNEIKYSILETFENYEIKTRNPYFNKVTNIYLIKIL